MTETKRDVSISMSDASLKAMLLKGPLNANAVGMVAPSHGLFLNKANQDSFKIESFDFWDRWGFFVKGVNGLLAHIFRVGKQDSACMIKAGMA